MVPLARPMLLALAMVTSPALAVLQEATPPHACPSAEYPSVGAMRIIDGTKEWSVCSPVEAYRSVIGASDDVVLIDERKPFDPSGVGEGHTIAYATSDGSEQWRRSTAPVPLPSGPVDAQGIVILATDDANAPALLGVDSITGEERWRIASNDIPLAHSPKVVVVHGLAQPDGSSQVRGIDRATGDEVWVSDIRFSDESPTMVARSPAAVLGDVAVIPTGMTVTAIDMRTGARFWQAPRLDHVAAADGIVVGIEGANAAASEVTAIDMRTGARLWQAPGSPSYGGLLAVGDGVVVVLDPVRTELVAYELDSGTERWRVTQAVHVEPQMISGTFLILLWEGEVALVSTTDGAIIWSATQPFGSPFMNSVSGNGDFAFIAINSLPWGD